MEEKTSIQTWTGKSFDYGNLDNICNLDLDDFVYPLAHNCRFNGHSKQFYSVAQHLVLVQALMESKGESKRMQFHGLTHDFGEAFFCDLPRPLKYSLPKEILDYYEEQESKVVAYVANMLGVEPITEQEKEILKHYDVWALLIESKRVMSRKFYGFDYDAFPEPDIHIDGFFSGHMEFDSHCRYWAKSLKRKTEWIANEIQV